MNTPIIEYISKIFLYKYVLTYTCTDVSFRKILNKHLKRDILESFATIVQSLYLGFGTIYDVLHVDGILALVFALLFVFLLENPLFADAEAAR